MRTAQGSQWSSKARVWKMKRISKDFKAYANPMANGHGPVVQVKHINSAAQRGGHDEHAGEEEEAEEGHSLGSCRQHAGQDGEEEADGQQHRYF